MNLPYRIKFLSYWQVGAGALVDARANASTLKDDQQLPFMPGRTMKGLLRDAAENLCASGITSRRFIEDVFGVGADDKPAGRVGTGRFNDAVLSPADQNEICAGNLQPYLYRHLSATAIQDRRAVPGSLRTTEVTIPLWLYGSIDQVDDQYRDQLKDCLAFVKKMGVGRNRGRGRCIIECL